MPACSASWPGLLAGSFCCLVSCARVQPAAGAGPTPGSPSWAASWPACAATHLAERALEPGCRRRRRAARRASAHGRCRLAGTPLLAAPRLPRSECCYARSCHEHSPARGKPCTVKEQRRERKTGQHKNRNFGSNKLPQNLTNPNKISAIDAPPTYLIDPRRGLQKDQESITNRKKNRNPYQELDLGKTSKSEPISERFKRGLNQ